MKKFIAILLVLCFLVYPIYDILYIYNKYKPVDSILQELSSREYTEETSSMEISSDVSYLLQLTNNSRTEPLVLNKKLNEAAKNKANNMFEHNYFAHNSPTGIEPWDWIREADYNYKYAGENIAMDFLDIDSTHTALMNSPLHKEVLTNPRYNEVGIAIVEGEFNGKQTTIVVEMFGLSKNK